MSNCERLLIARPGTVELAQQQLTLGDVVDHTNELGSALAGEGFRWQLLELVQHQLSLLASTLVILQVVKMVGKHAIRTHYRGLLVECEAKRRTEIGVFLLHPRLRQATLLRL